MITKLKMCKTCGVPITKDEIVFHVKIRKNGPKVHMTPSKMNKILSKMK